MKNLNSKFCPLTLLTGAEVQLSIQNALSLMLVYYVVLKGKTGHPFLVPTDTYFIRFHMFQALYSDLHMTCIKPFQILMSHAGHW